MTTLVTREETRLTVVVGREKDDRAIPFVIGAFNADFMDNLPLEDYDEQINKLKQTWTMDPAAYEWREIEIIIEEDLMPLFTMTLYASRER